MKGSIHYRKDRGWWFVLWYDKAAEKAYKITKYKGEPIYDRRIAEKLLALMQGDVENGTFDIQKYTVRAWTDVAPYLWKWLELVSPDLSPATRKDYSNSIKNFLEPYFRGRQIQLHEIKHDTLCDLANKIDRGPKGKKNVLYCLRACLNYAWRSERIPAVPPFPKIKVNEPAIKWLPEGRQRAVIEAIPEIHQPIFWFLKFHLRRPGEACALKWEDWDPDNGVFYIRRGISARTIVNSTKTGAQHTVPCHSEFRPILERLQRGFGFIFTNPIARSVGQRYTLESLGRIWKTAAAKVGESITMYSGLKHSTACQLVNDHGLSLSELQEAGDWKRYDSVKRYAKTEVDRRRELLEGKVIKLDYPQPIPKSSQNQD